MAQAEMAKQ